MGSRLFWKILVAFWLTFFCVVPVIWLPIAAHRDLLLTPEERLTRDVAPSILRTQRSHDSAARGPSPNTDGSRLLATSWQAALVGILSGLPFSVVLAWYLTRPIKLLRDGFRRMADGDLDVRLKDAMGRRRDEVADLAHDFDRMAAQLGQLVTARDRLLHDVSHELRSPLSRLQVAIGLARQDPLRVGMSLDRIEREAARLSAMVHELLVLARAESGAPQEPEYFDPVTVCEALVSDARFEAETSGIVLELITPDADDEQRPSLVGSAELFRRAVENVVRNALRFSLQGSTARVRVTLSADRYRVEVTDGGPGVPPSSLSTIFEPFVSAGPNGFGLGLAIARRAILAQRGSIVAENRPSGGLCVKIEVPVG